MADFYQSALFDPTAPSECFLKMLKKSRMIENKCKPGRSETKGEKTKVTSENNSPKSLPFKVFTSRVFKIKNHNTKLGKKTKEASEAADRDSPQAGRESSARRGRFRLRFTGRSSREPLGPLKNPSENPSPKTNSKSSKAKLTQREEKTKTSARNNRNSENSRKVGFYQNLFHTKEISPKSHKVFDDDIKIKPTTTTTTSNRHNKLRHVLRNVINARWTSSRVVKEDRQILVDEEEVVEGREEEENLSGSEVLAKIQVISQQNPGHISRPAHPTTKKRRLRKKVVSLLTTNEVPTSVESAGQPQGTYTTHNYIVLLL